MEKTVYIDDKELLSELNKSLLEDRLTEGAIEFIKSIVQYKIDVFSYSFSNKKEKESVYNKTLDKCLENWKGFKTDYSKPFKYFGTICMNTISQEISNKN